MAGRAAQQVLRGVRHARRPWRWKRASRAIVSTAARTPRSSARRSCDTGGTSSSSTRRTRSSNSARFKFLQQVERNYILLLTATPLQNDLRELYNLVTLLRPGQLGTWREFRKAYVTRGDVRRPRNAEALRELTAEVMIRTRRASVAHALDPQAASPGRAPDDGGGGAVSRDLVVPARALSDSSTLTRRSWRRIGAAGGAGRGRESSSSSCFGASGRREGLNLQFCNVLVNYELPWNPMVVEQRIGRIHRIGRRAHHQPGGARAAAARPEDQALRAGRR